MGHVSAVQLNTVNDWLTHISALHHRTMDLGLERVVSVAKGLQLFPFTPFVITVGGTNGKGSTVALLESMLKTTTQKIGAYTSPHLLQFNERIRINGKPVADEQIIEAFRKVESKREGITLTYFEFVTLAALVIFQQQQLDVVILEVGLGGRLDAVNIIDPQVAIITNVALDHMPWLGDDRESIAREKAGIIRSHRPIVFGEEDCPEAIGNQAQRASAKLYCLGSHFRYQIRDGFFHWQCNDSGWQSFPIPLLYEGNAAVVLQALKCLPPRFCLKPDAIAKALATTSVMGRCQILSKKPLIIADVAHNPQSANRLKAFLKSHSVTGKTFALFSMLKDKDISSTLAAIESEIDAWFVFELGVERGASCEQLQQAFQQRDIPENSITMKPNFQACLQTLTAKLDAQDCLIVFGSFHVVASALKAFPQGA